MTRPDLNAETLTTLLRSQRWFAGKNRTIVSATVIDEAEATFDGETAWLIATEVRYGDGSSERYFTPLLLDAEGKGIDALSSDRFCRGMLEAIAQNRTIAARQGAIHARSTPALALAADPDSIASVDVKRSTAEQSNSNIIYGDRYLLKWFRKLEEGPNPDLELGLHLADRLAPGRVPPVAGYLDWRWAGQQGPSSLGLLQKFVANQGSAWERALSEFQTSWRLQHASAPGPLAETIRQARRLGVRTAEMHQALADSQDPDFAPEPIDESQWRGFVDEFERGLRLGIAAARTSNDPRSRTIADRGEALLRRIANEPKPEGAVAIRCHGDYHLGQVLSADGDFVILDFEGEPATPLAERRSKKPPLKDVAGMLRSFDYAGVVGAAPLRGQDPTIAEWARVWTDAASSAFLNGYRDQAPPALSPTGPDFSRLLNLLIIEKAFYELRYELSNRPDWVYVPRSALLRLLADLPND